MKNNLDINISNKQNDFLMNFSEYGKFLKGINYANTVDLLPDNPTELFEKIYKTIPKNYNDAILALRDISKNDPTFFIQIIALVEVMDAVSLKTPKTSEVKVEKISSKELLKGIEQNKNDELYKKVLDSINRYFKN